MLLTIEFLGPYGAADPTLRYAPEWPPHPDRVFQALVDAANLSDHDEVDALRWLEAQPPPGIVCPEAVPLTNAEVFVPVNYPGQPPEIAARSAQPRYFPLVWPRGPVCLVWPDPSGPILSALSRVTARLSHVGRAESHVVAGIDMGSAVPTLVAHESGDRSLRVPFAGRLDELEFDYRRGHFSQPAPTVAYANRVAIGARGPWAEMAVVRLRRPLSCARVVEVTESLRRAVMSQLGDSAPVVAHGHTRDEHIAWVGLPNLSRFSRGELLGLGMALPQRIDPRDRAKCLQALLAVDHIMIAGQRVDVEPPTQALSLAVKHWLGKSRHWRTVSPVVLDHFPRRSLTQEAIVERCFERAGFPRPVALRLVDGEAAGNSARAYRLRRPGRIYSHVEAEFDVPVSGPMLIGAERYFGLGLFRPVSESRTKSDQPFPRGSRTLESR